MLNNQTKSEQALMPDLGLKCHSPLWFQGLIPISLFPQRQYAADKKASEQANNMYGKAYANPKTAQYA